MGITFFMSIVNWVVAQVCGSEVLNGVERTGMEHRLAVWLLHADVEGGDNIAAYVVLTRNVDATQKVVMIDSETWYLVHNVLFDWFRV